MFPSHAPLPGARATRAIRVRFLLAGLCIAIAPARAAAADERVNLAGTFNGWSIDSDDWRMEQLDDTTFRFVQFFEPGAYQFKFVFDGNWNQHLGAAGDHRLEQPGRDIDLRIPAPRFYRIDLKTDARTWSIAPAPPPHLLPILRVRRTAYNEYVLDASQSLAPDQVDPNSIEYEFVASTVAEDATPNDPALEITDRRSATLTLVHPGAYLLRLTARLPNGEQRTVESAKPLGAGFDLALDSGGEPVPLQPLDEHRYAQALPAALGGESLTLRGFSLGAPRTVNIPDTTGGKPMLLIVDDRTSEWQMKTDGWREFVFDPRKFRREHREAEIQRVELIGDFNNWNAGAHPMTAGRDGRYRVVVELPEGVCHYKFLINGTFFVEDRKSDPRFRESDGNGGFNSGVLIGDDAATFGAAKPGTIHLEALKHNPADARYFSLIASNVARFTVRTLANDVDEIEMKPAGRKAPIRLRKRESLFGFDYWSVQTDVPAGKTLQYRFLLRDEAPPSSDVTPGRDAAVILGADKAQSALSRGIPTAFTADMPARCDTPDWAKCVVWYQIFPERFRNGDKSNDPPRTVPWSHAWDKPYKPGPNVVKGSPQDFEEKGTFFQYIFDRRYGGDLQGVREKLPYLRDLGITAIYFNPIFQAESLHKYDTSDYRHIDDHFGVAGSLDKINGETTDPATWQWSDSDKVFLEFLNEAHRMGCKVILDGVFNHVGRDFWAFQDVLKNGKASPYADWFEITSWKPFHYKAWDKDDGSLPRLRHDDALGLATPVREHLFAVTRRWMDPNGDGDPSDGIDGWRLDVAGDINANFWRDWGQLVKAINPDAYIVAELWQESREWLDGETFDAVMNYPFARRCMRFVINNKKAITPSQFEKEVDEMYAWYRPQVNYVLQNLFDSHDTDRVASMCMNPDLEYDRENRIQDNGPKYRPGKPTPACYRRVKLLASIQMTFLGAPMIYYGDEAGLHGADDPSDRKPMLWPDLLPYDDPNERIESDVLEHYRRLIAIRNSQPALQLGAYEPILTDDRKRIFAFSRTLGNDAVIVVVNNSDRKKTTAVPVPWTDAGNIVRLDDPAQCELVMPGNDDPTARPTVRPLPNRQVPKWRIENGMLRGITLKPRSAAILTTAQPS